jgi:O-antigen ligase
MIRNLLIFFAALAALCGSLVAAAATDRDRRENLRGYVDPLQDQNLPFRVPHLGVNAELTQYDATALAENLDLMTAANIHWVRQFVRWDQVESTQGTFDWAAYDTIADAFRERPDLQWIAVLYASPDWTRKNPPQRTESGPPDNPADFAAFADAFARRYADVIDVYQVWDEPNLDDAWGGLNPRPADYLALLQPVYDAIHSADPGATVLAAALAPTTEQGPQNISDWRYLRDLLALGADSAADGFAGKPYGFDADPNDRRVDENTLNASRLIGLREVLTAANMGRIPLWASAWGWNSLPSGWQGSPSLWGEVSAEQQIAYTLAALDRADTEWPWLGGMILTHWQPDAPADDAQWGFALVQPDGTPSPLLQALLNRTAPDTATNGLYPAANQYAAYSGVWTFGPLGADIGWVQDSQLSFDFTGQGVGLLLREDNYVAYLYPTVDNAPANALPQDADGNAYLVLTSGSRLPENTLVPVARRLAPAMHTLRVVTDRGSDRWALAGYAVSAADLAAPYIQQMRVAGIAVAVSAFAVVVSAWFVDWKRLLRPLSGLGRALGTTAQVLIGAITSLALMLGVLLTWGDATPSLIRREPVQLVAAIASAGLIYLEPGLILTLVASVILFVLFFNRLDLGLLLVLLWTPFFLFPVELYRFFFPISELLLLILLPAWAWRGLAAWGSLRRAGQEPSFGAILARFNALDWGVVAWVALAIISLTWTAQRGPAITELRTMILEPALFYLIFRTARLDRAAILRLVDGLLAAGIVVAVVGLFMYFRGEGIITAEEGARRLASVYGSPNNVALLLGRCIPFTLAFVLLPVDRLRRLIAAFALLLMLATVLLTQSAGALVIGVPVALASVLILVYRRRALLPLTGLGVVGAAGLALALQSARFARLLDLSEGTNFYRLRVWQSAINVIRDNPVTGLGLDQFLYAFRDRYILPDAWQEPDLSHPHNFLLDFWVRLGIAGPLVFIWLQIAFWRSVTRTLARLRANPLIAAITIGCMGSMANLLAHGLVDNSVFVNDLSLIFVFLLALATALRQEALNAEGQP